MGNLDTQETAVPRVESILRSELARGDKALRGVAPVLTHLLSNSGFSLVSEAVVARVGGMLGDMSRQILIIANGQGAAASRDALAIDDLSDHLAGDSAILSHLYAIAIEAECTSRLEASQSIDPVLTPLLQELIGSSQPATAETAMNAMAAQSRFIQSQRRMELPINELPADLFHLLIKRCAGHFAARQRSEFQNAVPKLKRSYDESATRVGLLNRLVAGMGEGARAALDVEHAGLALFTTAISGSTKQPRELAALACHQHQGARLALCLRAAGLDEAGIERQFALIEPSERMPKGIDDLSPARAQAILGHSTARGVG